MRSTASIIVAALIAVSACSGDDDANPTIPTLPTDPPTIESSIESSTTTSRSSETSMVPPSVTPSSVTPSSVTPSTVTTATGNTVTTEHHPDSDAEKQAVIDAAIASWTAFNEVKLDPTNDQKLEMVRLLHEGDLADRMVGAIANFRTLGQASRTNIENPASVTVDETSVDIDAPLASVEICEVNSNILVEVGGAPDGSDALIDDGSLTAVSLLSMRLTNGAWVTYDATRIRTQEGGTACEPEQS